VTLFDLAVLLGSSERDFELDSKFNSVLDGIQQLPILLDSFFGFAQSFFEVLTRIDFSAIDQLPDTVRQSAEKWGSFGWIPLLPTYTIYDFIKALHPPTSQEETDAIMLSYFEENSTNQLFAEIRDYIDKNGQNLTTWNEAEACYNNGLYTSCALDIFALIDSTFVIGQTIPKGKKQRNLSGSAVKRLFEKEEMCSYVASAIATKEIIISMFQRGQDFSIPENGIKRNFLSHGMNRYIPDKTDCLKLFVLLYNVQLLFYSEIFHWEGDEIT